MELIRLQDVEFAFSGAPVLRGVTLAVQENAVTVLVGPSGSGKSTVLRLIAGFEAPQRGSVQMGGEVVSRDSRVVMPPEARGVSMVSGPGWRLWGVTREEPKPGASLRFAINKTVIVPA